MRHFVIQNIKDGRCADLNQHYFSTFSDEVFNIIPKELNVNGSVCEIIDKYIKYINKQRKLEESEYDSRIKDFRDINQEERSNYINKKLSKLTIHKNLQNLNLNDFMMDFDATSLNPSAMWDEKSVYHEMEIGFAFKPHMNDVYVEAFNIQTFNQDGNESAILKMKYYNPPDRIFQHLTVKEKVKNIEVNCMRNGISLTH